MLCKRGDFHSDCAILLLEVVILYLRIRELREKENLSKTAMAEKLHIGRNTYSNLEAGKTEPRLRLIEAIADYYQVSLDYLAGLTDDPEP